MEFACPVKSFPFSPCLKPVSNMPNHGWSRACRYRRRALIPHVDLPIWQYAKLLQGQGAAFSLALSACEPTAQREATSYCVDRHFALVPKWVVSCCMATPS